ncbi:MAG: right-handed parallel beta-helix repeat-containing protein, partial [Caldilineaceae bacterium]|nr:right-handed parallel beta-helix repeat-containing protein [Caldilineaceae bacterium]
EDDSIANLLVQNRFNGNSRYGVYLQETADQNHVRANTVMTNSDNGIYIRSSENFIEQNIAGSNGKAGIALLVKTGFPPPTANEIVSNTVSGNQNNGIDLRSAQGAKVAGNLVTQNQGDALYLKDGANQNSIVDNCLCENSGYGIEVNGADTLQNLWSRNSIYG